MAGALAAAPPGVSTRLPSSAVLSASTQRHRFQTSPSRVWRKHRSGSIRNAAGVVSATSDRNVVGRREAMSLSAAAGLGAFLAVSGSSRAAGVTTAAAENPRGRVGPNPHEDDLVLVLYSWQNWVKTWLV